MPNQCRSMCRVAAIPQSRRNAFTRAETWAGRFGPGRPSRRRKHHPEAGNPAAPISVTANRDSGIVRSRHPLVASVATSSTGGAEVSRMHSRRSSAISFARSPHQAASTSQSRIRSGAWATAANRSSVPIGRGSRRPIRGTGISSAGLAGSRPMRAAQP